MGLTLPFRKFAGEIFDCDCNIQLSTAIQLFNSDSLFQLPQNNHYFQHSTAIETSTAPIQFFNAQVQLQLSTAIATLNHKLISFLGPLPT